MLARELNTYLVVGMVWRSGAGMHDAAVLIGPDSREVGQRVRINLTSDEQDSVLSWVQRRFLSLQHHRVTLA